MTEIHGYELAARLRKVRRAFRITASEQALFYELAAVYNSENRPDVFACSNNELCLGLNISENAIIRARQTLINAGLISYRSGKSRRVVGQYSFVKDIATDDGSVQTSVSEFEVETADLIKDKVKDKELNKNNIEKTSIFLKRFKIPTVTEVKDYCAERENNVSAQKFHDYYSANGWKVGKNQMKDWQAAVRTWEQTNLNTNENKGRAATMIKTAQKINWE